MEREKKAAKDKAKEGVASAAEGQGEGVSKVPFRTPPRQRKEGGGGGGGGGGVGAEEGLAGRLHERRPSEVDVSSDHHPQGLPEDSFTRGILRDQKELRDVVERQGRLLAKLEAEEANHRAGGDSAYSSPQKEKSGEVDASFATPSQFAAFDSLLATGDLQYLEQASPTPAEIHPPIQAASTPERGGGKRRPPPRGVTGDPYTDIEEEYGVTVPAWLRSGSEAPIP